MLKSPLENISTSRRAIALLASDMVSPSLPRLRVSLCHSRHEHEPRLIRNRPPFPPAKGLDILESGVRDQTNELGRGVHPQAVRHGLAPSARLDQRVRGLDLAGHVIEASLLDQQVAVG